MMLFIITVDLNTLVTSNFSKVGMSEVILSLCQSYQSAQRAHIESMWSHQTSAGLPESPIRDAVSFCSIKFREEPATFTSVLTEVEIWKSDTKHGAALTGVGVYGEIRLALQYAVDEFSAVPVHRIVGIRRCYPSNRGTCETAGQSESVCSYRRSLLDPENMTWDSEVLNESLLKQPLLG